MFWFKRDKKNDIVCPKCLKKVKGADEVGSIGDCPIGLEETGCYQPFPIRYVRDFFTAETLPIQVFGWSGHGKTVFLDALRLMLLDMRKVWPSYTFQSISALDMEKESELRRTLRQGKMPRSTQKITDLNEYDVYVMKLENMMEYRDKWLIVTDYPGEFFENFSVEQTAVMPALYSSNTTFFIISIPLVNRIKTTIDNDSSDGSETYTGKSIDQLMNTYIETMLRMEEADKKKRNRGRDAFEFGGQKRQVIVVLTMADALLGHIPQELRNYLQQDTLWSRLRSRSSQPFTPDELQNYYKGMERASDQIRDWLLMDSDGAPGGANLVGLLENTGVTAHYSMISALGFKPNEKAMDQATDPNDPSLMPIQPKRVIDPFLWALKFDKEIVD